MSYIGNKPATNFETVQKQISTSNSGTTITLDRAVTSVQDILLTIDAVVQSYDNYSVSGTTLTVGGTLNNNRVEILYVGRTMQSVDPTDDSVSASKIKTDAVTTTKIQNDAVTKDKVDFVTDSGGASLEAKGSSGYDGAVRLNCSVNSHYTELKSASHGSYSGNLSFTLPSSTGTNGQFLQTNGSGVLSFANAGGGLVPISQSSGTSGTDNVIVNGWISDTYEDYLMTYQINVATNNADLDMTLYDSSGNISSGNEYDSAHIGVDTGGSTQTRCNSGQNSFRLSHGMNNDSARISITGQMRWLHPRKSGKRTTILHDSRMLDSGATPRSQTGILEFKATNALTGFYMNATSGQINYWQIRTYGIVNS